MTNSTPHFSTFDNQICCVLRSYARKSWYEGFHLQESNFIKQWDEQHFHTQRNGWISGNIFMSYLSIFNFFFCRLHLLITLIETSVSMVAWRIRELILRVGLQDWQELKFSALRKGFMILLTTHGDIRLKSSI